MPPGRSRMLIIHPGRTETVRVNGRAWITRDPALLSRFRSPGARRQRSASRWSGPTSTAPRRSCAAASGSPTPGRRSTDAPDGADILACQKVVDVSAQVVRDDLDRGATRRRSNTRPRPADTANPRGRLCRPGNLTPCPTTCWPSSHARGLVHDVTDRAALRARLDSGPVSIYVGFDPPPIRCTSATWWGSCTCAASNWPVTGRSPSPAAPRGWWATPRGAARSATSSTRTRCATTSIASSNSCAG